MLTQIRQQQKMYYERHSEYTILIDFLVTDLAKSILTTAGNPLPFLTDFGPNPTFIFICVAMQGQQIYTQTEEFYPVGPSECLLFDIFLAMFY